METHIAILNGNGIHHLAHCTRSRLHLEGHGVVASIILGISGLTEQLSITGSISRFQTETVSYLAPIRV